MALRVRDIMQHGRVTTIPQDTTVESLSRMLSERGFSGFPVVDNDEKLVGVVSQSDIVRLIHDDSSSGSDFYKSVSRDPDACPGLAKEVCDTPVSEIMERRIHSVAPEDELSSAARMMRNLHLHRVLVVRGGNTLVGIVSALDLLAVLESPHAFQEFYDLAKVKD